MSPAYTPMEHDDAVAALGSYWPPTPGATVLRLPADAPITDGAVAVYPRPGRPGTLWWCADSIVPPQGAGQPDERLLGLIPGSSLEEIPVDTTPDEPPASTSLA